MNGPYRVMVGTPGGEGELSEHDDPIDALREMAKQKRVMGTHLRSYRVLSDDTDPPETGQVGWCDGCGNEACLESVGLCEWCIEEERESS